MPWSIDIDIILTVAVIALTAFLYYRQLHPVVSRPVVNMRVAERGSGKMVDELVPAYLKVALMTMYGSRISRRLVNSRCTSTILKKSTSRHGRKMDAPKSSKAIQSFIRAYGVNTDEAEKPVEEYKTFNEFFSRFLRPGLRPIACPDDPSVAVCPADCRLLVFPSLAMSHNIWLKGERLSIQQLLGEEFEHILPRFHNPAVAICRLAPQDYHRWHMPIRAKTGQRALIHGTYLSVSPRAVRKMRVLDTNKREVALLHSAEFGTVALVAVGAAMVSSIAITAPDNTLVEKGTEHGYFGFGGSTLVLVFQENAIEFDADLLENSMRPLETLVRVGMTLGRATGRASDPSVRKGEVPAVQLPDWARGKDAMTEHRSAILQPDPPSPAAAAE